MPHGLIRAQAPVSPLRALPFKTTRMLKKHPKSQEALIPLRQPYHKGGMMAETEFDCEIEEGRFRCGTRCRKRLEASLMVLGRKQGCRCWHDTGCRKEQCKL